MMSPKDMGTPTDKEGTISIRESDLFDLLPLWSELAPTVALPADLSVADAMKRGRQLRHAAASGEKLSLDLHDQSESADVLHAAVRSLMDDCGWSPRRALLEASVIRDSLTSAAWPDDPFEEKESLLNSLAFVAWRAARILDLSREVYRWQAEYKRVFRQSVACLNVQETLELNGKGMSSVRDDLSNPESLFQALIYLHDQLETNPKAVSKALQGFYGELDSGAREMAPDLRLFLLAEAATLLGAALRTVGNASEVAEWLGTAEEHFRAGVNPKPGLARVLFLRLNVSYTLGRFDVVIKIAPQLEATFAELGMDEDRVKSRILWASSLKLEGFPQEALAVLEPAYQWRSRVRPALYGWVVLQAGDIHQTLGNYDRALEEFGEAARLFREGKQFVGLADIGLMISTIYRAQGRLEEALHLLETSRQDHARLEMTWPEGYHRMLIAETYLAMGRPREAEKEIRAALPLLEEQGMLADAVVAVNLLREAVRQRKLDPADNREPFKPKK